MILPGLLILYLYFVERRHTQWNIAWAQGSSESSGYISLCIPTLVIIQTLWVIKLISQQLEIFKIWNNLVKLFWTLYNPCIFCHNNNLRISSFNWVFTFDIPGVPDMVIIQIYNKYRSRWGRSNGLNLCLFCK